MRGRPDGAIDTYRRAVALTRSNREPAWIAPVIVQPSIQRCVAFIIDTLGRIGACPWPEKTVCHTKTFRLCVSRRDFLRDSRTSPNRYSAMAAENARRTRLVRPHGERQRCTLPLKLFQIDGYRGGSVNGTSRLRYISAIHFDYEFEIGCLQRTRVRLPSSLVYVRAKWTPL